MGGDSLIEIAGHLLPCFQTLLPERSIYRVTKLSSDTGQSLEVLVLRRHNGGELTSWPPAFGLLLYLIVVLTIYGICMGLSLRHCAMDVHMSAVQKKRCSSLGGLRSTVAAVAGERGKRRAEDRLPQHSTRVMYLTLLA